jgi:hypothetical protein
VFKTIKSELESNVCKKKSDSLQTADSFTLDNSLVLEHEEFVPIYFSNNIIPNFKECLLINGKNISLDYITSFLNSVNNIKQINVEDSTRLQHYCVSCIPQQRPYIEIITGKMCKRRVIVIGYLENKAILYLVKDFVDQKINSNKMYICAERKIGNTTDLIFNCLNISKEDYERIECTYFSEYTYRSHNLKMYSVDSNTFVSMYLNKYLVVCDFSKKTVKIDYSQIIKDLCVNKEYLYLLNMSVVTQDKSQNKSVSSYQRKSLSKLENTETFDLVQDYTNIATFKNKKIVLFDNITKKLDTYLENKLITEYKLSEGTLDLLCYNVDTEQYIFKNKIYGKLNKIECPFCLVELEYCKMKMLCNKGNVPHYVCYDCDQKWKGKKTCPYCKSNL